MSWFPSNWGLSKKYQKVKMKCSLRFENDKIPPQDVYTDGKNVYFWTFFKYIWRKVIIFDFVDKINTEQLYHFDINHFIIKKSNVYAYCSDPKYKDTSALLSKISSLEEINKKLISNAVDIVENVANTPMVIQKLKFGMFMFIIGLVLGITLYYIIINFGG